MLSRATSLPRTAAAVHRGGLVLLWMTLAGVSGAGSGSVSGSGSGSGSSEASAHDYATLCRNMTSADAEARYAIEGGSSTLARMCDRFVCGAVARPDYRLTCVDHPYHSFESHFNEAQEIRPSAHWAIAFLAFSLLVGAMSKTFLPTLLPSMPYTVCLLLVGIGLGLMGHFLSSQSDCPMFALQFDADHDSRISRAEWANFVGATSIPGSFCLGTTNDGAERSCGDGSDSAVNCRWTFDDLNNANGWKASAMWAESVRDPDPDQLTADELFTVSCNAVQSFVGLSNMDPHLLLVVFLPALLFESACFGLDIGIFKKQIWQICLMAFPAMILSSLITGGLLFALAPSGWSFVSCWLIGVIASATDPVAVVALLKELGASKQLGTLIEGESLLNDGSAVVLFVWVKNMIGYTTSTNPPSWMDGGVRQPAIELLRIVAQMLVLGILFGWMMGWFCKFCLRFVYNDRFVEASLVISITYFAFWLGELFMGSSAVLAVVVMGLYMNVNKSSFSPEVLHYLHGFYEMVAEMLNTIIFLIAGCKLGYILSDASFLPLFEAKLEWNYLAMILLMYPIVLVARGAGVALHFPLLKRLGTRATWKEAVVMWWGGLRGSVGLALGLVVHHTVYDESMWGNERATPESRSLNCRDQPNMVLVLTVIVVCSTVVINGGICTDPFQPAPSPSDWRELLLRTATLNSGPVSPAPDFMTSVHRCRILCTTILRGVVLLSVA